MTALRSAWLVGELVQWRKFLSGERDAMPEDHSFRAARVRFGFPTLGKLSATQFHAMSIAAAKFLPRVPYTGVGCHRKFLGDVIRRAVIPESLCRKAWPEDVFALAVRASRRALFDLLPGNSVPVAPVDNDAQTQ